MATRTPERFAAWAGVRRGGSALLRGIESRPWPALALLLVACGGIWLYAGRDATFLGDEWDFLYYRRSDDLDAFLIPHNQHLVVAMVAYFKVMWPTVGIEQYWPYVLVNVVLHLAVITLVFELFRRRAGALAGLAAASLLAFTGDAQHTILWDFQFAFLLSAAAGIGVLMALERPGWRAALAASVLLTLSLAAASWGLAFTASAALLIALRREWSRMLVIVPPVALYAAWTIHYRPGELKPENLPRVPEFVADSFAATLARLGGVPQMWGRVLVVVAVASLVMWLVRVRRPTPIQVAALSLPLFAWIMTAVARADTEPPAQPIRYAWVYAVLVLVAVAYVAPPRRLRSGALLVLAVVVSGAVLSNLQALRDWTRTDRPFADIRRAQLGAMDIAEPVVPVDYVLEPLHDFGHFQAANYFAATDAYGSPGYGEPTLKTLAPEARAEADGVLMAAAAPAVSGGDAGERACTGHARSDEAHPLTLILPKSGIVVTPARRVEVRTGLRRFADGHLPGPVVRSRATITPPADRGKTPWELALTSTGPFRTCD